MSDKTHFQTRMCNKRGALCSNVDHWEIDYYWYNYLQQLSQQEQIERLVLHHDIACLKILGVQSQVMSELRPLVETYYRLIVKNELPE